jgi:hypothetical protein
MRPTTLLAIACLATGCAEALYPPRPPAVPGPPVADPLPARVVIHSTWSKAALAHAIDTWLPQTGEGTFQVMGSNKTYHWRRTPAELSFDRGRLIARAHVMGQVTLLGTSIDFPIDLVVRAEPIIASDYLAHLQSVEVEVTSNDARLKMAQGVAGALDLLRDEISKKIKDFSYDLRPFVDQAYARVATPIDLPLGEAHGCAELRVTGVEAAPTVLADGIEKDLAIVVAPAITLPCAAQAAPGRALPPLANVASLPPGPFTVTVPIAARYEELARAMTLAFTNGKLFFSKEFPELYLSDPEVYAASDQLVIKLHVHGPIKKSGIHTTLDGDIFFSGHPAVVDNELRVPDLQPTIETSSFLLKLKAALDGNSIRDEARNALRLDLGARLAQVKAKLSSDLDFQAGDGMGSGCLKADVARIEVTGVHPHGSYLRLYVAATAQAGVYLPCPAAGPAAASK